MATPTVKHKGVVKQASDLCARCGVLGHIMSDHFEEKGRQCSKCACVPQDTA